MDEELFIDLENENNSNKGKKINLSFDFNEYKSFLYTAIFYAFGLFTGSYFYKITQFESINNMLAPGSNNFFNLFVENFCLYFSIFLVVVFLGFCLIGYPVINIIPTIIGIASGIKISYFMICYGTKGIGYALIMLVPFYALFLTVIAFTIEISTKLSSNLLKMAQSKNNDESRINIKKQIRKYLICAVFIIIVSAVNSGITCLLYSVVTI